MRATRAAIYKGLEVFQGSRGFGSTVPGLPGNGIGSYVVFNA